MFTDHSLRGRVLNRALHHQHARVYNYDKSTMYGRFDKPCKQMTQLFLELVQYDHGGRIFTYVLTLDGLLRFTETGKEFGIDMLSKHTMHSDVSIYIAFSGEFFIRRLKQPRKPKNSDPDPTTESRPPPPDDGEDDRPKTADSTKDPSYYELVIDNDSGTYRPNAKMLHTLKEYLKDNLPGLRVVTLDCQADAEKMKKLKDQQREAKKSSGQMMTYMQNSSSSSISSSEEEELEERAGGNHHESKYKRQLHKYVGHGEDNYHYPTTNGEASHGTNEKAAEPMGGSHATIDSSEQPMNEKENFQRGGLRLQT